MITAEQYKDAVNVILQYHKQIEILMKDSELTEVNPNKTKIILQKHYMFLVKRYNLHTRTISLFEELVSKYNLEPTIQSITKNVSINDMYKLNGYGKSTIEPIVDILSYYNISFKK